MVLSSKNRRDSLLLIALLFIPIVLSLAAVWLFDRPDAHKSVFSLSFYVGPTAESLLQGTGLNICSESMGTVGNPICFHAARMPMASAVVALGVRLLGDRFIPVAFFKVILLLLPVELAIYLVWRHLPAAWPRKLLTGFLLVVPFAMTPFLSDVVQMQIEEDYLYSLLALAVALLFFTEFRLPRAFGLRLARALLFALTIDAIYLSKSSMILAVFVLVAAFLIREKRSDLRLLVLILALAAPIGWALHQHHASGRYSLGTSLDGMNLHKGNNESFLVHYPPPPGENLDGFDRELNVGRWFPDEWAFNDYHQTAALQFIRTHPRETGIGIVRKLDTILFTLDKVGSPRSSRAVSLAGTAGIVVFRLIFWTALAWSLYRFIRWRSLRPEDDSVWYAATFLALFLACAIPYVVGFGFTRHISILIYPSVLLCCVFLTGRDKLGPANRLPVV